MEKTKSDKKDNFKMITIVLVIIVIGLLIYKKYVTPEK